MKNGLFGEHRPPPGIFMPENVLVRNINSALTDNEKERTYVELICQTYRHKKYTKGKPVMGAEYVLIYFLRNTYTKICAWQTFTWEVTENMQG